MFPLINLFVEKEEMIDIPPMPETFDAKKKEYNVRDVIRQYIGCETARIFEGNLIFDNSLALENNRYNVVIGNFDISKFIANNPPLPKVIFGNLIINKNANVGNPEFLGGKKIKKWAKEIVPADLSVYGLWTS